MIHSFLNDGITSVISILEAQKFTENAVYPPHLNEYQHLLRGKSSESAKQFLYRILHEDEWMNEIYSQKVSEKFLVFIEIRHKQQVVDFVNVQAFITEEIDLMDLAVQNWEDIKETGKVFYYRLDYDINNLGDFFKEPLPHIHIQPKGNPRVSLANVNDDLLINFFEFIYKNHFYEEWLEWTLNTLDDYKRSSFSEIRTCYKSNNYETLANNYKNEIDEIKKSIEVSKRNYYIWRTQEELSFLSY